jgi:hypothetical protein
MKKVNMKSYQADPLRYELRKGNQTDAPDCPYGNKYQWIGYDLATMEYVRFTKSVFKLLISNHEKGVD